MMGYQKRWHPVKLKKITGCPIIKLEGISVVAEFIPARTVVQIFAKLSVISRTDKTGLHRSGGDKPRHYLIGKFCPLLIS
jgi:hypothetical protein